MEDCITANMSIISIWIYGFQMLNQTFEVQSREIST